MLLGDKNLCHKKPYSSINIAVNVEFDIRNGISISRGFKHVLFFFTCRTIINDLTYCSVYLFF